MRWSDQMKTYKRFGRGIGVGTPAALVLLVAAQGAFADGGLVWARAMGGTSLGYAIAVDGAGNESEWSVVGSFYVGSGFTLPVTALRVLIGLAIAGAGFFGFWLGRRTAYAKRT